MLPGIIGSLQAMEAIKLLANLGHPPLGRLIHYRALSTLFREIKIKPDPDCPLCGDNPTITKPITDKKEMTELPEITTLELRKILTSGFEGILLDVREQDEYMMAQFKSRDFGKLSHFFFVSEGFGNRRVIPANRPWRRRRERRTQA